MTFFSKNSFNIKFFSEMYYHVFSTKADQEGVSIQKKKNLFPEKLPLKNFQGRNPSNFWLVFCEKRRPHKYILNLTDQVSIFWITSQR